MDDSLKMSRKRGPYKQYLLTGGSPSKSTKYDHARKRVSDSDSSTDDMEEYYDILEKRIQFIHKTENVVTVSKNKMSLDTTACNSAQSYIDCSENITENTFGYKGFDVQNYEAQMSDDSGLDACLQESGSSSEAESPFGQAQEQQQQSNRKPQQIPQYELRNTLDVGQHQHNMENPQQQRNVRSMSAPPENRNQNDNLPGQPRFVSRVEITPQSQQQQQANQTNQSSQPAPEPVQPQSPQSPQQQREKSPVPVQKPQVEPQLQPQPQTQPQPQPQHQGNVRHIPIFVEGRDEPIIAKDLDEPDFIPRRQQSPPQFHRPSHFQQQQYNRHPPGWTSTFQDPFFEHTGRWPTSHQSPPTHSHFKQPQPPERFRTQQAHHPEAYQNPRAKQSQPQQKSTRNEVQPEAPTKPRQQIQPKDPLERVAMVQNEVDALTEQVKQYTGNSRQDKQYMYLDEMLTRELIKLDDIETEGKENVRQARKQAIKSIQESISLLESKAPLPGQHQEIYNESTKVPMDNSNQIEEKPNEIMQTSERPVLEEHKAIPLPPPYPSSPNKNAPDSHVENIQQSENNVQNQEVLQDVSQAQSEVTVLNTNSDRTSQKTDDQHNSEPMDSSAALQVPSDQQMEVRQSSPVELQLGIEQQSQTLISKEQNQETKNSPITDVAISTEKPKKEPPPVPQKPFKSPKKAKKTKKQPEPVSETAIPLPAPGQSI